MGKAVDDKDDEENLLPDGGMLTGLISAHRRMRLSCRSFVSSRTASLSTARHSMRWHTPREQRIIDRAHSVMRLREERGADK